MNNKVLNSVQVRISNNDINIHFNIKNNQIKIDKTFLEAILISSPSLYKSICNYSNLNSKSKLKVVNSLRDYSKRINSRATPYGIFTAVGIGEREKTTNLENQKYKRVYPTMEWLMLIRDKLLASLNNISKVQVQWNALIISSVRLFLYRNNETISIANTEILLKIKKLTQHFIDIETLFYSLRSVLPASNYSKENILQFISELIKKKILTTSLDPLNNNSIEYFNKLIKWNNKALIFDQKKLMEIKSLFSSYERIPIGEGIKTLEILNKLMNEIVQVSNPIFVDLFFKNSWKIESKYYEAAEESNEFFEKTATGQKYNTTIKSYLNQFVEKYGINVAVPLKTVFDPIRGLGNPYSIFKLPEGSDLDNKIQNIIDEKILKDIHNNKLIIDITNEVDKKIKRKDHKIFPLGYDLFTTPIFRNKNYYLAINPNTGFNSPKNVWGRFNYVFENQKEKTSEIEIYESLFNKKLSNLDNKENSFDQSSLVVGFSDSQKNKLNLDEIAVCAYSNDQNVMKFAFINVKNQKQVSFRITSMINFKRYDAYSPILRFLIEVSYLNKINNFSLLNYINNVSFPRIPRFTYKHIILNPARWEITSDIISDAQNRDIQISKLRKYLCNWNCPYKVFYLENDVKLQFDLRKNNDIEELLSKLHKNKRISLIEDISSNSASPTEYVFSFKKLKSTQQKLFSISYLNKCNRIVVPNNNDKWLYYQIYTPRILFKDVLKKIITPLITRLKEINAIDEFFYIYYLIPEPHLRIRFHIKDLSRYTAIRNSIENELKKAVQANYISKYSLSTYEREIERYGGENLFYSIENIFSFDSSMCLRFAENMNTSYLNHALLICKLLFHVGINSYDEMKEILSYFDTKENKRSYGKIANKISRKIIYSDEFKSIKKLFELMQNKEQKSAMIQNIDKNYKKSICVSLIHLHFNRMLLERKDELKIEYITYKIMKGFCNKRKYDGNK
ncbi:hypothetical protein FD18_GL000080 [Lactobacillus taiwanensis DSM 21401]|jgi:thiopeptide-type bacteriocin biosynthesis domain|uniref:lantibiotic dehydratase n=1 Tax=Lactobacillus taiwanensis TaxID=508451 RepID=UPI0006EEF3D2|nr:lantibiotic dehydratase [Lactobacillus taiwanensis]KRN00491.1 hypothetical protein FD18_GL000080 [Lactobacillus taiwanensis DSM 21401]